MRWLNCILLFLLWGKNVDCFSQQNISDLRVLLQNQFLPAEQITFSLTDEVEWKFSEKGKNDWKKASVPGCVHTDLNDAREYYQGENEKKYQWIGEKDWTYETRFRTGAEIRNGKYTSFELVFEQLDLNAMVFLNGKMVLLAVNAFCTWKADISSLLKKDTSENILRVEFRSPVETAKRMASVQQLVLPGEERVYARKAQFEFGWDFGPRLVTCGMRKPVYIVARTTQSTIIDDIQIVEKKRDSLRADLEAVLTVNALSAREVYICRTDVLPYAHQKIRLQPGANTIRFPFTINHPVTWWPRGYGESVFYPIRFTLQDKAPQNKKSRILSEKTVVHAFCQIELVKENDTYGQSFYFRINGQPVFAKGVNMIPYDVFTENWNDAQLNQVYQLNANMVRIWGGGYYPSNEFYLYCLANGILVWQDFMFACAMYPSSTEFLNTVKNEVKQQVVRLRQYKNIAVWCGNNENNEGWHNWGWQKQYHYTKTDSAAIWKSYLQLFHEEIPAIIQQHDPGRVYWPSSPLNGWGRDKSLTEGDCHYWGVWWGLQPIDTFNYRIPRFMSEYGMQSMPAANYILKYAPPTEGALDIAALLNHQKHPSGFDNLNFYLDKYYKVSKNIDHYAYASQLLQADALQIAIEAHRRHRNRCMGTLLWQMNDCWPGITWSLVDHDLHPKIAYEQVKKSFETIALSVEENEKEFQVYVISDSTRAFDDTLSFALYDTKGKEIQRWSKKIRVLPGHAQPYLTIAKTETSSWYLNSVYALMQLHGLNKEKHHRFVQANRLLLEAPTFSTEIVQVDKSCGELCEYEFRLTTNTYCPGLTLYPQDNIHPLIYRSFVDPLHPLVIRFWEKDYAYYRNLTQQPAEKFLYLYKLMREE